jgi:hypothetical protein
MVVRNEEALVEYNVRYHLEAGFDIVAILEHCSTDNTPKILATLANDERVILFHSDDPIFDHGKMSNFLLRRLLLQNEVDWVFPLDVDEFFYSSGGVHAFLQRMICYGVRYGTIPWFNAVLTNHNTTSANALFGTKFYRPWPEREWQHDGMFRKAFCKTHDRMEIVVGGHYFRREANIDFFGKGPSPVLLPAEDACIYHYEFRGSIRELMLKWSLFADYECDSSSRPDAPWLERLKQIRSYVAQWRLAPDASAAYWSSIPRTFWGTPIPSELIIDRHHIATWVTDFETNKAIPKI